MPKSAWACSSDGQASPPAPGNYEVTPTAPGTSVIATGPDGRFSFKDISAGTYRILAAANGFIRQEYGQKTPHGRRYTGLRRRRPDAEEYEYPASIHWSREWTRPSGVGATCDRSFRSSASSQLQRSGSNVYIRRKTTVNDRGEYRMYGVAPGRYYLMTGTEREPGPFAIVGNPNGGRVENYAVVYYPGVADLDHAVMIDVTPASDNLYRHACDAEAGISHSRARHRCDHWPPTGRSTVLDLVAAVRGNDGHGYSGTNTKL